MRKLKIVLAMPSHSNFAQPIEKNLKHHDFDVTYINCAPECLKHIKLPVSDYFYHLYRKVFHADLSYKAQAKQNIKQNWISNNIRQQLQNQDFDYALVIRPDLFFCPNLVQIKQQTQYNFVGYQWNGLNRFPDTMHKIHHFDRFFAFDHQDLSNEQFNDYQLLGCTNFYFDMYQPEPAPHEGIVAYFVGLHFDDRSTPLDRCAQALAQHGIQLDFNIKCRHGDEHAKSQYQSQDIQFIEKNINFDENIQHINHADILVDVVNPVHLGLSFRTFEALYYEKKLITNNAAVQDYDFYHPNNMLIWDGEDLSMLEDFLSLPYHPIDDSIRNKYSFGNWIRNMLDLSPYQPIRLPNLDHALQLDQIIDT